MRPTVDLHCPRCPQGASGYIAAQIISHIPASKRGEYLVMKRLGLASGMSSPSMSSLKAYEEIFSGDHVNMQTICELFLADGEVGARKQRRWC
jgi:hypothetical protein